MAAPKTKSAANGTKKSKASTVTDNSAPAPSVPAKPATIQTPGKPDKAAHDAEQERIKAEMGLLQEKLVRRVPRRLFSVLIPNVV